MKIKHLRIGNIVTINNDSWAEFKGVPLIVTGVGDKMDTYNYFPNSTGSVNAETLDKKNDFAQFDEFIEPILLTEDWLLKFGFELFPWGWVLDGILIRWNLKDKYWIELGNGKRIEILYVHTLQNFFALTGIELK